MQASHMRLNYEDRISFWGILGRGLEVRGRILMLRRRYSSSYFLPQNIEEGRGYPFLHKYVIPSRIIRLILNKYNFVGHNAFWRFWLPLSIINTSTRQPVP